MYQKNMFDMGNTKKKYVKYDLIIIILYFY